MNQKSKIKLKEYYNNQDVLMKVLILVPLFCILDEILYFIREYSSINSISFELINVSIPIVLCGLCLIFAEKERFSFYIYSLGLILMQNFYIKHSLIGKIGVFLINLILSLFILNFCLKMFIDNRVIKLKLIEFLFLGCLLYETQLIIYYIKNPIVGYENLVASSSIIMIGFAFSFGFGKFKYISAYLILIILILNEIVNIPINGYNMGFIIFFSYIFTYFCIKIYEI
ncbi:MAG: hypothetical protein ACTSRZ_09620 [Promethearchaeota archaeon]